MQRDVLIKNDSGAQITFVAPDLYEFGIKEGFIKNQRKFETEEMLGIGGSTFINTIADMEVCIEGSLIPVTIQVVPNKAIEDRNFQILLGTDNTQHMGATIDLGVGHTTYSKLPGINRTLTSMHLSGDTATRVFNSSRVCEADAAGWERKRRQADSVERPEYLSPRWSSTRRMDKELAAIPAKVGMKARFMEDEEAMSMVDGMAKKDTQLLRLLVDSLEKCMKSGDKRQYKAACDMLGITGDNGSNEEVEVMGRMARAHRTYHADEAELKKSNINDSFTFEYDEDTKRVRPVGAEVEKIMDRAGHGWREWSKEEIRKHVLESSDVLTSDKQILDTWIDNLYLSAQPPTEKLPAVSNHYFYVKLRPDAVPWKAHYTSVPRNLMGRLKDILDSMIRMDIIEKTDSAEFTCPITLVMGKDKEGNSTISRLCCDARAMNKNLITEPETVPNMHEIMMHAEGGYIYSTTDLVKSFWETKIAPNSRRFCAFRTALGCFIWKRKFFGIRSGSSQQQKLMNEIIGDDLYGDDDGIACYVDDAVLWSRRRVGESDESVIERHSKLLDRFTQRLADRRITLSIEKSSFFQKSIDFLGYTLGRDGVSIQEQKRAAIIDTPHPQTASQLHTFIGGVVWLQKCLRCNTAQLLARLRRYVIQRQTDRSYINTYDPNDPEVLQAVRLLKEKIAESTTLFSPRWNWEFHVFADGAQSSGVGGLMAHFVDTGRPGEKPLTGKALADFQATCEEKGEPPPPPEWKGLSEEEVSARRAARVLQGGINGRQSKERYTELDVASGLHLPNRRLPTDQLEPQEPICAHTGLQRVGYYAPIAFHSKSIQKAQARWTSREVEVFAIITMLRRWESYLLGSRIVIHTDCKCLEYLAKYQDTWGKLGRWCNYLSMFGDYSLIWCKGIENGVADWLSRAPLLDGYCPDDGEMDKEKYKFDDEGNLVFNEMTEDEGVKEVSAAQLKRTRKCRRAGRYEVMTAERRGKSSRGKLTMYSVCAGIGSCMQAVETLGLPVEPIGCCENDPEVAAELAVAYPHVPNHGDMRTVIAAMESGELELRPDILVFTVPCQARSRARLLTEWYDKEHPHQHLWDLQAKFIALAKPRMVLIESVPPRSYGSNPTAPVYEKLEKDIREMGYNYTKVDEFNFAEYGGDTSRRRYMAVATKGMPAYEFPAPVKDYKGFRDLLEPAYSVRHNYRCRLSSPGYKHVRLSSPLSSKFASRQIGKVLPETEKEKELAGKFGMLNPKGFRIYSSKQPAPTICSYGSEKYCGPGRNGQFITDKVGIRTLRATEAARIHNFLPRVVDQLSALRESFAFKLIGNSVPVLPLARTLKKMVKLCRSHNEGYEMDEVLLSSKHKMSKEKEEQSTRQWYPSNESMLHAQRSDPDTLALREQLLLLQANGVSALKKQGVSDERLRYLQLVSVDSNGLLRCSDINVHMYGADGKQVEQVEEKKMETAKEGGLDCSEARVLVPKGLREGILFIHHYTRLACHASWMDMMDGIQEAGYTWKGLGLNCKQMTSRCMECMQAKRAHSKLGGLHSSRRYTRPFDTISWDMQDLGKASETTHGKNRYLLTVLCEFTSFPELYSLPDKTAESIADCLVDYCLRWGKPSCIWSGHDAEIKNEVVKRVCAYLEIHQVFTSPRNSNAQARQERKHRQINESLQILVNDYEQSYAEYKERREGKGATPTPKLENERLREWDEYLPLLTWKLRNSKVQHLGFSPWEMVYGRRPQTMSPSWSSLEGFNKCHPRARKYMESLTQYLETMWKETDRVATIGYIKSWPKLNAKRKDMKCPLGGYVMLHQPVHIPKAPTALVTSWCGPWKVTKRIGKDYELTHIDSARTTVQARINVTAAPEPMHPKDYDDRFDVAGQIVRPVDRISKDATVATGQHIVAHSGTRNAIGEVLESYADGSCMVQWYNTKKLDNSKTAAWYPSWYAPMAKHGELAGISGDIPTWEIIQHEDMVTVFEFDERTRNKDGGLTLPSDVRKYFG
jgi:site-specific DNA-cytosine methylase